MGSLSDFVACRSIRPLATGKLSPVELEERDVKELTPEEAEGPGLGGPNLDGEGAEYRSSIFVCMSRKITRQSWALPL